MKEKLAQAKKLLYATENSSNDIQGSIELIIEYLQEKEEVNLRLELLKLELNNEISPSISPFEYEMRFKKIRILAQNFVDALEKQKLDTALQNTNLND